MDNTKFTKGKWHLMKKGFTKNANDNLIQVYATNEDLEFVCQVWKDGLLHAKTQNFEANALLISKAPEMLEMLIRILTDAKEGIYLTREDIPIIEQLIKEATEL
jgi:hypothetical protein